MNRFVAVLTMLSLVSFMGCGGGSGTASPAVEQDELSKWVEQNPAPEVEVSPDS